MRVFSFIRESSGNPGIGESSSLHVPLTSSSQDEGTLKNSRMFTRKIKPHLENILKDPDAKIILSDLSSVDIIIARFLKNRQYRNVVLYHVGKKPRVNVGKFQTRGKFQSNEEVLTAIRTESDTIIEY